VVFLFDKDEKKSGGTVHFLVVEFFFFAIFGIKSPHKYFINTLATARINCLAIFCRRSQPTLWRRRNVNRQATGIT